ncbi:MAG TPA: ABC transporter permease [Thermoanaerobaculia bacterium]|nr:ABC transporter permease [Thermoanaerobaculia bacterium]
METIWQDLQYGLRRLAAAPWFTATAVLSLALGIGANTTIFTLVDAVLVRTVPVSEPERLVRILSTDEVATAATGRTYFPVAHPNFEDLREQAEVFSSAALYVWMPFNLGGGEGPAERVFGQMVGGSYFEVLGVEPALGRLLRPEEDDKPGAPPVIVLSHGLWQNRFGGDPGLVGRTIPINGLPFTVVGVAPRGFRGVETIGNCELWVPMSVRGQVFAFNQFVDQRRWRLFEAVARLAPAVSLEKARTAVTTINARLESAYPADNQKRGFVILPLTAAAVDPNQRQMFARAGILLLGVAGLVLLLACSNVANLLLARAASRRKEIAVRLSLGATRDRLVRQLLTESLLLALLAGGLGLLVAVWLRHLLWSLRPPFLVENAIDLGLNPRVLLVTLAISLLCGVLFGLVPALRASRPEVVQDLKDQVGLSGGGRRFRLLHALVVLQVALSLVALIGAGLFVRSLRNTQAIELGFDARNLLAFGFDLAAQRYEEARGRTFQRLVIERVKTLPEVESVALAQARPMVPGMTRALLAEGVDLPESGMMVAVNSVGPGYFETLRIPLLSGRAFDERDRPDGLPVAIVNETLASRLWPGGTAIGRRVSFQGEGLPIEVVGVVRDSKYRSPTEEQQPFLYLALDQRYSPLIDLLVRTRAASPATFGTVRRIVGELDPNLPPIFVQPVEETIAAGQWGRRMITALLAGFGVLALVLATMGLYATLAYSVRQRSREIAIRSALGAQRPQLLRMVVMQALLFVGIGLALGLAAAWAGSRVATTLLFGISATDPGTFASVSLLLGLVALLASLLPARRAAQIEPLRAMRYE